MGEGISFSKKNLISVSLVIYCNKLKELTIAINCALKSDLVGKIYLIDNSPTDVLKVLKDLEVNRIVYLFQNANLGFGSAHNVGINLAKQQGYSYHLILNPDIYFEDDVISSMIAYIKNDALIGMMMPQILNLDGSIQSLPKLLPSPFSMLFRKIKKPISLYQKVIDQYELRNVPRVMIYNSPILSGCFTLLNLDAIKKVGMYDDSFFMYFEDWDLSRRMHQHYKTIYFPLVSVFHGYDSGANKSSRLFKIFIKSAITYFNKWGWFFDTDRKEINKRALAQFK